MFVAHDSTTGTSENDSDLFGMNPPRGVYFYMEFQHNLQHPSNHSVNPEQSCVYSAPQRTMAEARALAHGAAVDWATQIGVDLVHMDIEFDEDGVQLPSFTGMTGEDDEDPTSVVFRASVRFFDYRGATIH